MLSAIANHLWQSTLFAGSVGLLTLLLRTNRAQTRHGLWLVASIKFLVPFSLLIAAGSQIGWRTTSAIIQTPFVLDEISQPFAHTAMSAAGASAPEIWPALALILWFCGCGAVFCSWALRWQRCRSALSRASVAQIDAPIEVRFSPALLEPGVFGIFRPILLLPQGIADRMTKAQLDAILAHELCHVRRRDNLAVAIHMLVEATFWFHPLVWWIGARLVDERERACDEEVLRLGNDPQIYAEGILKVCQFYLESPLVCVAGISGSSLGKRIEDIMTNRITYRLNTVKRALLTIAAATAVAGPLSVGILNSPRIRAQQASTQSAVRVAFEVASIKRSLADNRHVRMTTNLGGVDWGNISLGSLVGLAYGVKQHSMSGPDWLSDERFDVTAKLPSGAKLSDVSAMLQSLLAERFRLTVHREQKVMSVYELLPGMDEAKLHRSTEPEGGRNLKTGAEGRHLTGRFGMATLTSTLSSWLDRPLVDKTGLTGIFDIDLTWSGWEYEQTPMYPPGRSGPDGIEIADLLGHPTIISELRDKLGLKVRSRMAPVEILIVDHAEKAPAEN